MTMVIFNVTGLILILAMRFLSRFMTTKRLPWKVKACRSSGIDCVSWMTSPAIVVASSSGSVQSSARFRSRIGTVPSTTTEPSASCFTP